MMSMHFPYGNTNTAGQQARSYGTAVCPGFGINYNPYFSPPFYSNSNGLQPTPLMPPNRQCKELISKPLVPNSYPPPFPMSYGPMPMNNSKDFLTFLEQKPQPISGLNPFANEFSLGKNLPNGFLPGKQDKSSSYQLIFDDLIEKSLKSIHAIEKASKIAAQHHVWTQCESSTDQINRSTQTYDEYDANHRLEEYSSSAVKLMENLKYFLEISCDDSLTSLSDELYELIVVINQLIRSNNPSHHGRKIFSSPSSPAPIRTDTIRRLISSTPTTISSSMIDPITTKKSKRCLLCQKPLDHSDDLMHEFCRLFSSPPMHQ